VAGGEEEEVLSGRNSVGKKHSARYYMYYLKLKMIIEHMWDMGWLRSIGSIKL